METEQKKAIKADDAIKAYRIMTTAKTDGKDGFVIATLDTEDMFRVLRAVNAIKPIAVAFDGFVKDVQGRLKPEGWDEMLADYNNPDTPEERKAEIMKEAAAYEAKVAECVHTELEKDKTPDAYERLGKDAFGKLVKANSHLLDVPAIMLLQAVIGEEK